MQEIEIDFYSDEPAYTQLADELRRRIIAGRYAPREAIPSSRSLAGETGLNEKTVRKAVRVLRDEGLVRIVPGRGAFVVER